MRKLLQRYLAAGSREHYEDALLYDHEYKRRKDDVAFYRKLARKIGGPVLELGCGTGRITLPLAEDGHEIVGVDASVPMLARLDARRARLSKAARDRVQTNRADFRRIRLRRKFPLIIAPFNTLQHCYERGDVEAFLATVRSHLARGGRFAFDIMNPDLKWLSRDSQRRWARTRFKDPATGRAMIYETDLVFDTPLQIAFMRIFYRQDGRGRERVVHLTHRYFFPRELEALLAYNGFSVEKHDGDFSSGALESESEQQVVICRRA